MNGMALIGLVLLAAVIGYVAGVVVTMTRIGALQHDDESYGGTLDDDDRV